MLRRGIMAWKFSIRTARVNKIDFLRGLTSVEDIYYCYNRNKASGPFVASLYSYVLMFSKPGFTLAVILWYLPTCDIYVSLSYGFRVAPSAISLIMYVIRDLQGNHHWYMEVVIDCQVAPEVMNLINGIFTTPLVPWPYMSLRRLGTTTTTTTTRDSTRPFCWQ